MERRNKKATAFCGQGPNLPNAEWRFARRVLRSRHSVGIRIAGREVPKLRVPCPGFSPVAACDLCGRTGGDHPGQCEPTALAPTEGASLHEAVRLWPGAFDY